MLGYYLTDWSKCFLDINWRYRENGPHRSCWGDHFIVVLLILYHDTMINKLFIWFIYTTNSVTNTNKLKINNYSVNLKKLDMWQLLKSYHNAWKWQTLKSSWLSGKCILRDPTLEKKCIMCFSSVTSEL